MNKKLITLCVSALLAGGMVAPSYAALNLTVDAVQTTLQDASEETNLQYYVIKFHDNAEPQMSDWCLKGNFDGYTLTDAQPTQLDGYSLWRITAHKNANGVVDGYQFVNAYGIPLAIDPAKKVLDKNGSVTVFNINNSAVFYANVPDEYSTNADNQLYIDFVDGATANTENLKVTDDQSLTMRARTFSLASTHLSASELTSVFGDHFALQIGKYNDKGEFEQYALEGNAFVGKLYPKTSLFSSSSNIELEDLEPNSGETYLVNENNEVIVLLNDLWDIQNTDLDASTDKFKGYKFATMTSKELGEALAHDKAESDAKKHIIKSYIFRISGINAHIKDIAAPLEVAVKMDYDATISGTPSAYSADSWAELLVAGVDETYYLTTATAGNSADINLSEPSYTPKTYVRFGENNFLNAANFWGKAWNIVRDGRTFVPNVASNGTASDWIEQEKIGLAVPEGQWILFESDKKQQWINRETGEVAELPFAQLRSTEEANVYEIVGDATTNQWVGKYRITEAAVLGGNHTEYFGYDVKESTVGHEQTYKIAMPNKLTGEPAYISMNAVGQVKLTADPTEAINFQVTKVKTTDNAVIVSDADVDANVDVFQIYNDFMKYDSEKKAWVEDVDTISYNRYYFSVDGKYLNFDEKAGNYVLVDSRSEANKNKKLKEYVEAYIIKEKGGDFVNILNMGDAKTGGSKDFNDLDVPEGEKRLAASDMMYFDYSFGKAYQQENIYDWNANAQLNLDDNDYNIYRNVAPTAPDTMAIYRTEYQDEFLFEKNDFLGMTVDQRGYNAALFIDTAYVRNNTEKPLFMIGLRPEITPETVYCPLHGPNAGCAHEHLDTIPGYVDADYLTVLADSAAFHAAELKNEFLANSAYTKLAFIQARHNVDTITVADDNHKTTIVEGVQHPMVFAFRIVNQETKDFIIEGVDLKENKKEYHPVDNPYVTSWVRWNNGVPVMTDRMEDAEVFNIEGDIESAPTANEAIEAEATVSVIATDGAVIVKGAEGKNVIVSTILGKVVANEVINSDYETIAAPAGIVVVSVDGESFKVAVK